MTKSTIGLSVGLLGLFSPETRAQDDAPIDANQIALDPTGTGLLTIGNGTLLEPGHVHAHAVLQHLSQPVVRERVTGSARTLLVPRREQVDLAFSAGLMDRLQVSARVPLILSQPSLGLSGGELSSSAGWADPELALHTALLDGAIFPLQLGASIPVTVPVGRSDAWMSHGGWTVEPRLVAATLNGPVRFATRVGFRLQSESDLVHYQTQSKIRAAAGVQWYESETDILGLELLADLDVLGPTSDVLDWGERQSLELLAGYTHDLENGLELTAGLGTGLTSAVPTPRWRAMLSISWTTRAVEIDPCKHLSKDQPIPPECPDPMRDDLDQDGILNVDDQCPTDPEDFDGDRDLDGCPDP